MQTKLLFFLKFETLFIQSAIFKYIQASDLDRFSIKTKTLYIHYTWVNKENSAIPNRIIDFLMASEKLCMHE